MYFVELTLPGSTELVAELLVDAPSAAEAQDLVAQHIANWDVELFSLVPATPRHMMQYGHISGVLSRHQECN